MAEFERDIKHSIIDRLGEPGKAIILYGPRQVGKTWLAKEILAENDSLSGYFNCEDQTVAEILATQKAEVMIQYFGGNKIIVLDEAQSVPDIGMSLKILIDAYPELQLIATGSSSFELASKISEPLTGRHYRFFLYPLSFNEIASKQGNRTLFDTLDVRLIFGTYPEIVNAPSVVDAREKLTTLATSYMYRDVLRFQEIRSPQVLGGLLKALAFQVGNEVSQTELASLVGVDKNTVARYLSLLEQAFVIFRLPSYSRNMRNEIKRGKKYYFYDNGLISTLTDNFVLPGGGRDVGGLWENLMVSERLKFNQQHRLFKNLYFWRLRGSAEIDLIEECDGKLTPFEFKWNKDRASAAAKRFTEEYNTEDIRVVNKQSFIDFVR